MFFIKFTQKSFDYLLKVLLCEKTTRLSKVNLQFFNFIPVINQELSFKNAGIHYSEKLNLNFGGLICLINLYR